MKKVLALIILCGSTFAHADIKKIDADYSKCAEEAISTMDSRICASEATDLADKELNLVFQTAKKELTAANDADSKEILKRLVAAQRAWITYRDANCSLGGTQMLNGSGESQIISGCIATTTIERVIELKSILGQ